MKQGDKILSSDIFKFFQIHVMADQKVDGIPDRLNISFITFKFMFEQKRIRKADIKNESSINFLILYADTNLAPLGLKSLLRCALISEALEDKKIYIRNMKCTLLTLRDYNWQN